MTSRTVFQILSLAAVAVAAPASAQTAGQPAQALPPVSPLPHNVPPPLRPSLPSAQQAPTPAVVIPARPRIVNDTTRVAAPVASVTQVPDLVAVPAPQPAGPAAAPLPIINQPGLPPANATGRCKDGTYLTGATAATDANCSTHGGLGVAFQAASAGPGRAQ